MDETVRFPIRFTGLNRAMVVLGLTRRNSFVEITQTDLIVQLGWSFQATAPRGRVRGATHDRGRVWGWGAHGWRGSWLINGSSSGLVRIELEPASRGRIIGFPLRIRVLRVAVEDPDGLITALAAQPAPAAPS